MTMYGRLSYAIQGRNPAGRWKIRYNREDESEADYVLILERRLGILSRLRSLFGTLPFKKQHRTLAIPFDYVEGKPEGGEGMVRSFSFYRRGVQVGKVDETALSDRIIEELETLV